MGDEKERKNNENERQFEKRVLEKLIATFLLSPLPQKHQISRQAFPEIWELILQWGFQADV